LGSLKTIQNEPLFYNQIFLDTDNSTFALTRFKSILPKTFKELQTHIPSKGREFNEIIAALKRSVRKIEFTQEDSNIFFIEFNNARTNVVDILFKDIYKIFLDQIEQNLEWEAKWGQILENDQIDWMSVWGKVNSKIHNREVQSSIWEMTHINYWSGYKAKEKCKLCDQVETDTTHIINNCPVLLEILNNFGLRTIFNTKEKISFGSERELWENFVLCHIKSVVFRARFQTNVNKELISNFLSKKCKTRISNDLLNRLYFSNLMGKTDEVLNSIVPQSDEGNNNENEINIATIRLDSLLQDNLPILNL
jgi:hypothetical protein